jgi:hypothetical protein
MPEQVFINCLPEELPLLEGIEKRLELAGLSCYIPPAHPTPELQQELVEKISSIAAAHGCMVCILSNRAVSNSLFLSNIQLMCETSHTGRVLIYYQVERLENDQNIRLFSSQAYQVKKGGHPAADTAQIIQRIHQVLHPNSRNIFHFLCEHISRRVLSRLSIAALVLGVSGSILFNALQPVPVAIVLPTPTPAVLYVPFSGQSQDMGLTVDTRFVPEYIPATDPVTEAPFAFKPEYILEQEDFSDPAFENTYDRQKWKLNFDDLDDASSVTVTQSNGVLQMAMAPLVDQQLTLGLDFKYLYNLQQVTYLGYRFRLEEYQGKIMENTWIFGTFSCASDLVMPKININGLKQDLFKDNSTIGLGSRWHTIEMISQEDRNLIDMYLDGIKFYTVSIDDEQLNLWIFHSFKLDVSNTTDWVRMQIDEIIFGADKPWQDTLQQEDAPYRFTPDTIALYEDFETQTSLQYQVSGREYVTQANGVLSFRVPAGKDDQGIRFELPGRPINESNYYATRFRFTGADDNYWANWAIFSFGLENKYLQSFPDNIPLQIGAFRQEYVFFGMWGLGGEIRTHAHNQNAQPGNWHTLEMVIKPPVDSSQAYIIYFWVDGYLLPRKGSLKNPSQFLDTNSPLVAALQISSGSYRQNVFSGEIDDLVIGFINSDRIKE